MNVAGSVLISGANNKLVVDGNVTGNQGVILDAANNMGRIVLSGGAGGFIIGRKSESDDVYFSHNYGLELSTGNFRPITLNSVNVNVGRTELPTTMQVIGTVNATSFMGDGSGLTGVTVAETDPVYSDSIASGISVADIGNWNTAFGWGDHATAGYLTSFTETDPTIPASLKDGISWGEIGSRPPRLDDGDDVGITTESDPTVPANLKDGVSWGEVSSIPPDIADGDQVGIVSEVDPQVGTNTTNYVSKWNGSQLVTGTIFDNGNIGIGVPAPNAKLDVSGACKISGSGDVGSAHYAIVNTTKTTPGSAYRWIIYNMTGVYGDKLSFWSYDFTNPCSGGMCDERFSIYDNGDVYVPDNVGIGTTNPAQKLHGGSRARSTACARSRGSRRCARSPTRAPWISSRRAAAGAGTTTAAGSSRTGTARARRGTRCSRSRGPARRSR